VTYFARLTAGKLLLHSICLTSATTRLKVKYVAAHFYMHREAQQEDDTTG